MFKDWSRTWRRADWPSFIEECIRYICWNWNGANGSLWEWFWSCDAQRHFCLLFSKGFKLDPRRFLSWLYAQGIISLWWLHWLVYSFTILYLYGFCLILCLSLQAEECLKREKDRVAHYLHSSSEPKLLEVWFALISAIWSSTVLNGVMFGNLKKTIIYVYDDFLCFHFLVSELFCLFSILESSTWTVICICKPTPWKGAFWMSCITKRWQGQFKLLLLMIFISILKLSHYFNLS